MATKHAVTPRIAGPVDIGGSRFPLSRSQALAYVQGVHRLVFGDESFLVILYGALDAYGLIGTEHNGIAVLWEDRGKVALLGHGRDGSYQVASDRQRREYATICGMDLARFRAFVNDHPGLLCPILVAKPRAILRPAGFRPGDFAATEFHTAADKAKFLATLVRFLCNHCDEDRFDRRLYNGLHTHLGHIAHYDRGGFHAEWFRDAEARIRFLAHHATRDLYGDWGDVGRALRDWIGGPEGRQVLDHYRTEQAALVAAAERRQLALLKAKYEPTAEEAS
jgi:hypothetical protein